MAIAILLILALLAGLVLIPFGLPGLWLMVAALVAGLFLDLVGPAVVGVALALALAAEAAEFVLVQRVSARYGGSRLAFWGALVGGFAGLFVGVPVPVIGPLLTSALGSFAGAAAVTAWETRELRSASRVGWGAVLGRALAAATKMAVGFAVLVLGAAALLV